VKRPLSIVLAVALLATLALVHTSSASAAPRTPPIAPLAACPHQGDADASTEEQLQAMRCMTNLARRRARLDSLASPSSLSSSSQRKAEDILRCDSVSHFACGRSFTYWMKRSGYLGSCWRVAENIALGTRGGTAHSIFQGWLRSPEHRRNILGPYHDLGIGLETGRLDGRDGIRIWIQHFGSRCS
jgi:uncharacterized protein YkwD